MQIYSVELSTGVVFDTKVTPYAIEDAKTHGATTYLFPYGKGDKALRRTVFLDHIVQMVEQV